MQGLSLHWNDGRSVSYSLKLRKFNVGHTKLHFVNSPEPPAGRIPRRLCLIEAVSARWSLTPYSSYRASKLSDGSAINHANTHARIAVMHVDLPGAVAIGWLGRRWLANGFSTAQAETRI